MSTHQKKTPGNHQAIYYATSSASNEIGTPKIMEPVEVQPRQVKPVDLHFPQV